MRIAVIADIHGNFEAFKEVLAGIRTDHVDRIISLGDNVGYGPDPEPVMALIRDHKIDSVLGNHEMAMKDNSFIAWFNPLAQKALLYTRENLSALSFEQIRTFPKSLVVDDMRFVHGAPPSSPVLYLFQIPDARLVKRLDVLEERIFFVGHTHELMLIDYYGKDIRRNDLYPGEIHLEKGKKYMINVGSVGQPRDMDKRAKYVLYDTESGLLTVKSVDYPNTITADKIIRAGIPKQYAEKLL